MHPYCATACTRRGHRAAAGLRRPLNEEQDQDATRAFAAAWMVVAQTSAEELGGTPRQFEMDSSIAREHVVALLEGTKLRLRARISRFSAA